MTARVLYIVSKLSRHAEQAAGSVRGSTRAGSAALLALMTLGMLQVPANVISVGETRRTHERNLSLAQPAHGQQPIRPLGLSPWPELRAQLNEAAVPGRTDRPDHLPAGEFEAKLQFAGPQGALPLRDAPSAGSQALGTRSFYYDGQLQQRPTDWAEGDVVCEEGSYMLVKEGLHAKTVSAFDGSNYEGIKLSFLQRSMSPASALPLYDLELAAARVASVASVLPAAEPTAAQTHRATAQAGVLGSLLFSCLLGYWRRSGTFLAFDIVPADPLEASAPAATSDRLSPTVRRKAPSCIYSYGRVVTVTSWAELEKPAYPTQGGPTDAQLAASVASRNLSSYRLRGSSAVLSPAAQLSLLLMRTSGRV